MEMIAQAQPKGEAHCRSVRVAGHDLDVFTEWAGLCKSYVADIASAQKRVWVEVYIFHDDSAGRAVAEALKERSHAGVDVRVLADAVGSQRTPAAFWQGLREAGVKVHLYHAFWESFWRARTLTLLNRRNHRKLTVVDDRVGYFGGMNIIDNLDAPTAAEQKHGLPMSAGWRDVHVRIQGPQVVELGESFDRSWRRAQQEPIPKRPRAYRKAAGAFSGDAEWIRFFDSGPGLKYARAARVFVALLHRANSRVVLSMAYFVPIGKVLRMLFRARRRGVQVQVIIPGKSDVPLVQRATMHLYRQLLRRGFEIYERQNRMLHSKVMVADGRWSVVGSANMDPRSLVTNLEFLGVIHSRAFARVLEEICMEEIAASRAVTWGVCERESWWNRLLNRLAWSLRWWL